MGKRSWNGIAVALPAAFSLVCLAAGCAGTKVQATPVQASIAPAPTPSMHPALAGIIDAQNAGVALITVSELRSAMASAKPPVLVDVLPESSYSIEHIAGAISLPLNELSTKAATVLPEKDAPVIVYCAGYISDASLRAALALKGDGYTNVQVYKGGLREWTTLSLPTAGEPVPGAAVEQEQAQDQNEE